jgi:hypothetical protein
MHSRCTISSSDKRSLKHCRPLAHAYTASAQ